MNTNGTDQGERELEERSRQAFRESVDAMDGATQSRLNRARQQALAELAPAGSPLGNWLPVGVTVALAVVAVAVWMNQDAGQTGGDVGVAIASAGEDEDLALMLEGEDLDMLAELEFYDWVGTVAEFDGESNGSGNIG